MPTKGGRIGYIVFPVVEIKRVFLERNERQTSGIRVMADGFCRIAVMTDILAIKVLTVI